MGADEFESMTDGAKRVLGRAREEARRLGDPAVGTRHVLLGMILDALNAGATILEKLTGGLSGCPALRMELEAADPAAESAGSEDAASPYGRVLTVAGLESSRLGSPRIGSEHLLLGLLRVGDGIAFRVLAKHGVTYEKVHALVEFGVSDSELAAEAVRQLAPCRPGRIRCDPNPVEWMALAREDLLDPVFGREDEIDEAIEILIRRSKNNVLLVGEPGSGRKAIARGVAWRISRGDVPADLRDRPVLRADPHQLGGLGHRRGVAEGAEQPIVVIDEIEAIFRRLDPERKVGGVDTLAALIERGEVRSIATTTPSRLRGAGAFARHLLSAFAEIRVQRPPRDVCTEVLAHLRRRYAAYRPTAGPAAPPAAEDRWSALRDGLIGQEEAARTIADAMERALLRPKKPPGPLASFLFVGPPGTGRRYAAMLLAESLFHFPRCFPAWGALSGPVASRTIEECRIPVDAAGFVDEIRARPRSVIVVRSLDRTDPSTLATLCQALEPDGIVYRDGVRIDLSRAVLVMTCVGDMEWARSRLPSILLERVDAIVAFLPVTRAKAEAFVRRRLEGVRASLDDLAVGVEFGEELQSLLADRALDGGISVPGAFFDCLEARLARKLAWGEVPVGARIRVVLGAGAIEFEGVPPGGA